jgi:potassium-dependent mechanosensitive channel
MDLGSIGMDVVKGSKSGRSWRAVPLALFLLTAAVHSGSALGQGKSAGAAAPKAGAATPSPSPGPTTTPSPNAAIPPLEVVTLADELSLELKDMIGQAQSDQTLQSVSTSLKSQAAELAQKQRELDEIIAVTPTRLEVDELDQDWVVQRTLNHRLRDLLAVRAKSLEADLTFLTARQEQWSATRANIPDVDGMNSIRERVAQILRDLQDAVKASHQTQADLISLQNEVSTQGQIVSDALARIRQIKVKAQHSLWFRDGPPIWKVFSGPSVESPDDFLKNSYRRNAIRTRMFVRTQPFVLWGVIAIFLGTLGVSVAVRRAGPALEQREPELKGAIETFQTPVSLAILTSLTALLFFSANVPQLIRGAALLLCIYPVLKLYVAHIPRQFRALIIVLIAFGLLHSLLDVLSASEAVKRFALFVWQIVLLALLGWLSAKAGKRATPVSRTHRPLLVCTAVLLLLLAIGLIANIVGNVSLSIFLSSGGVASAFGAVVLRTEWLAISSLWDVGASYAAGSPLSLLRLHGKEMAAWSKRIAALVLFYLWAYLTLTSFGVHEKVTSAIYRWYSTPLRVGAAGITLGDVGIFLLVLVCGVILAGIIRVLLRDDILARLNLKHGIPYAISTITYYIALLLVFVLALAAAGVELSRFTLLTGAFGVGLGFGLQNTINNFAAGIILLFERPIRVGDFLEVGDIIGEVERIGMRSSSMRTPGGAVAIVPNSNLVTSQVINWTLSKQKRRVDLLVAARREAEPKVILELMRKVASEQPGILTAPKPDALYHGYERGFQRFELRFWIAQVRRHQAAKSEVGVKINEAFRAAGVDVHFGRMTDWRKEKAARAEVPKDAL